MSAETRAAWAAAWRSVRLSVYAALAFVAGLATFLFGVAS